MTKGTPGAYDVDLANYVEFVVAWVTKESHPGGNVDCDNSTPRDNVINLQA